MANKLLRISHYPQVPCKPFQVEVRDLREAALVFDLMADYDDFQLKNNIKPDYCNATTLEEYDPKEKEWLSWCDEESGEDEFRRYLDDHPELLPVKHTIESEGK